MAPSWVSRYARATVHDMPHGCSEHMIMIMLCTLLEIDGHYILHPYLGCNRRPVLIRTPPGPSVFDPAR